MGELSEEKQKEFEECLAQARAGSREAFDQLIKPFQRILRSITRLERRLQAKVSESDLVQITNLKAFENLSEFSGSTIQEFGRWLFGIMEHAGHDQSRFFHSARRDVSREVPLEVIRERLTMRQAAREEHERSWLVEDAMKTLPKEYREIIRWRFFEKRSYKEIGARMGRLADAAKHLCYRAVRKLGQNIRKHEEK